MTIILGPQIPTPNFRAIAGRPRAWYLATTARTWHRRHTGLGAMVQPPPPPPLPAPVGSWRENVLAAHSLFSSPRRAFVAPPAGTSLDDLLLVREALGVRDAELTPLADAASTFASRVAGDLRFRDLLDALPALFLGMEKGIRLKLEEGQRWAARQAEKECRNK
jgi:hypothetical protein